MRYGGQIPNVVKGALKRGGFVAEWNKFLRYALLKNINRNALIGLHALEVTQDGWTFVLTATQQLIIRFSAECVQPTIMRTQEEWNGQTVKTVRLLWPPLNSQDLPLKFMVPYIRELFAGTPLSEDFIPEKENKKVQNLEKVAEDFIKFVTQEKRIPCLSRDVLMPEMLLFSALQKAITESDFSQVIQRIAPWDQWPTIEEALNKFKEAERLRNQTRAVTVYKQEPTKMITPIKAAELVIEWYVQGNRVVYRGDLISNMRLRQQYYALIKAYRGHDQFKQYVHLHCNQLYRDIYDGKIFIDEESPI